MKVAFHDLKKCNITIEEAEESLIRNNLFCSTIACRVPISFRASHFRKTEDKQSLVKAHFKIKNEDHVEICPFNTVGQVKMIARDSYGVLESLDQGSKVFRLNLITSIANGKGLGPEEKVGYQGESQNAGVTKRYGSKGELTPYLSTINKIVKLRSEIEGDAELSSLIKLSFNSEEIKWSNFYYERESYRKCFNYIKSKKPAHPICIEGKIKKIEGPSQKRKHYKVTLVAPWVEKTDKDNIRRIPLVSIAVHSKKVAEHVISEHDKGKKGIAFYSVFNANASRYGENKEYLFINGRVNHKQQVHLF